MTIDPFATVPIGRTDVRVPRFGLGTAPLGGWPEAIAFDDAVVTVRHAWDRGVRYFDTAPFYGFGSAERILGAVLPHVPRDDFVVSTKVGRVLEPKPIRQDFFKGADPNTPVFDFSYDGAMRSFESSLLRLGLDRIDIALIHDPDDHHNEALAGAYKALDALRAAGTVGAIGVGMNETEPLARFAREADFDCFLLAGRYTLLRQDALDELFPTVEECGMSIIAGGVYNSGVLADPDASPHYNYAAAPPDVVERVKAMREICAGSGVPLRAVAARFPLAHPVVATVAIGSRTPSEVDDNLAMLTTLVPTAVWDALREAGFLRDGAPTPMQQG